MTNHKRTTHKHQGFTPEQMQGFSILSHKASAMPLALREAQDATTNLFATTGGEC